MVFENAPAACQVNAWMLFQKLHLFVKPVGRTGITAIEPGNELSIVLLFYPLQPGIQCYCNTFITRQLYYFHRNVTRNFFVNIAKGNRLFATIINNYHCVLICIILNALKRMKQPRQVIVEGY